MPDGHAYNFDRVVSPDEKAPTMQEMTSAAVAATIRGYNRCLLFHGSVESGRSRIFEGSVTSDFPLIK